MVNNNELKGRIFGMGMINPATRYKNLEIKDLPIMITRDNKILCIPNTSEVKHCGMTGQTGCQPAGSKVLMADGSWKNIEEIKEGDLIISPQEDGSNIFSKIKQTTKWFSNENYSVCEKDGNILYNCSFNHLIPIYNKKSNKYINKEARNFMKGDSLKYNINIKNNKINKKLTEIKIKKYSSGFVYGFELDSESKWYITDNWMVTHNTCKSIFMNSMISWDHWVSKRCCINLNDFQKETFEYSLPTDSFIDLLKKINVKPCPNPLVYVFPSTKTIQIEDKDRRFPIIQMTLPLDEVIRNIEYYYKLDKSKVYLRNLMEELIECNSISEIKSVIEENLPEKHVMMKFKIMNIFEALFNNNMINVSVPEAPAFLEYGDKYNNKYYNYTIQTLLRAGLIPSIQTSDLRNHEYFAAYMSFIVESIYKNQYENKYFKNKSISLFVDEIDKLWLGNNGNLIKKSLNLIGTNGRSARIGLRWSTQNYGSVPDQIRTQTKYLIVSRKANSKEVSEIKKDFQIPKSMDKDILNLKTDPKNGIFEVVALTTERFCLYDISTGKMSYSTGAHKGYLIPPMAMHHRPDHKI